MLSFLDHSEYIWNILDVHFVVFLQDWGINGLTD